MTPAQRAAGDTAAFCTLFLTWALLAPVVAGPIQPAAVPHNCPSPQVRHGVGADLKSYMRRFDGCSITSRDRL